MSFSKLDDKLEDIKRLSQDLPGIDLDHTLTALLRLTENNLEKYDDNNVNNNKIRFSTTTDNIIEKYQGLDADSILIFAPLYKQGYDPIKNTVELKKMKLSERQEEINIFSGTETEGSLKHLHDTIVETTINEAMQGTDENVSEKQRMWDIRDWESRPKDIKFDYDLINWDNFDNNNNDDNKYENDERMKRATKIYDVLNKHIEDYDERIIPYIYMKICRNYGELKEKYQLEYNPVYEGNDNKINHIISRAYEDVLRDEFHDDDYLNNFKNKNYYNVDVKYILKDVSKKLNIPVEFPFDKLLQALKLNYD